MAQSHCSTNPGTITSIDSPVLDSTLNIPKLEIEENPTVEVQTPIDLDSQMRKTNVSAHSLSTSLLVEEKLFLRNLGGCCI